MTDMDNPWLDVPAADYEAHMNLPEVGQLAALSRIFKEAYELAKPTSLAVLGCATGNGFEHIDPQITGHVAGVDINGDYLEIARNRHANRLPGLELLCADLEVFELPAGSFDLIMAGLIFEYVDPAALLAKIAPWLRPGGILAAVLQVESEEIAKVTPTPYTSLNALDSVMHIVDPQVFKADCVAAQLMLVSERIVPLQSGKAFWAGRLRK